MGAVVLVMQEAWAWATMILTKLNRKNSVQHVYGFKKSINEPLQNCLHTPASRLRNSHSYSILFACGLWFVVLYCVWLLGHLVVHILNHFDTCWWLFTGEECAKWIYVLKHYFTFNPTRTGMYVYKKRQCVIWTSNNVLSIGPFKTNFNEIKMRKFSVNKMHLKSSSSKRRLDALIALNAFLWLI